MWTAKIIAKGNPDSMGMVDLNVSYELDGETKSNANLHLYSATYTEDIKAQLAAFKSAYEKVDAIEVGQIITLD